MAKDLLNIASRAKAKQVVQQNKSVPFVKRMLMPGKYPQRSNPDGTSSSHLLGTAEVDGIHYVYPTLRYIGGKLVEDKDVMTAIDSGNVIAFDDPQEADEFAKGSWKLLWKDKKKKL